jgi:hypothetical protein
MLPAAGCVTLTLQVPEASAVTTPVADTEHVAGVVEV